MAPTVSSKTPNNSIAYINGQIYTINPYNPWAYAFIVSPDGIFTTIGTNKEILSIAKSLSLIIVDLKNQFVMPGIHDAHMHVLYSGLALTSDTNIGFDSTSDNIAQKIKEGSCACHYTHAYEDWILANMFNNEGFPDMVADRKYLDDMFPDTPVVVRGGAGHSLLLNTEALKRAGYDVANEPDIQASRFVRRQDGSLTGELSETAMNKAMLAFPDPPLAHVKRALKHAIRIAHQVGVTSCQEASANSLMLHALRELDYEEDLKIDFCTHIMYAPEYPVGEKQDSLIKLLDKATEFKSRHVDTRFVKIILDGIPLPPLFTHCGLDGHGKPDQTKVVVEGVADAIAKYDQRGMTVKIHCAGQGSTRMALDAIESVRKQNPNGPRHEIAHNSGVHDDEYPRYKPLNVTAEMSPAMFFTHPVTASSGGLMDWNFTKMLDAGAHLTIGSDWGAAPDPSLFGALAGIVETVGGGSKDKGAEILCRMLTINGAEAVGKDKEVGSIEVGKKANFIVVDRNLSKGEFGGAGVVRTYFEGELVWERGVESGQLLKNL
ncbi:amidohydrolase 3 [Lindgomyces ingoldianus]|uniref:Amidohydrolase 3 n=1 Tax=Lindgomyces ingoldianus TaxID=673940 RepID=A0ACB6QGR9_9PLEO|nr:amidohydrolase 3 [Lindgomyces ingoldianus]KAF2466214.1 amidohydrolase 3 [Lindgomyces ingoldianus]